MMKLIFLLAGLIVLGQAPVGGSETPSVVPPAIRHTSSLKFFNGTYSSIFGIVPKEYRLESQETRETIQRTESDTVYSLELVASDTRRILSLEGETPTIETGSKPLTGKTLRRSKNGGEWKTEIIGVENPSEEELKEAFRLITRFAPGASPFEDLVWSPEGTAPLDVAKMLTFLGYTQTRDVHGTAIAKRPAPEKAEQPIAVEIEANFTSGDGPSKLTVDLKAAGSLQLDGPAGAGAAMAFGLEGKLVLHGHRKLPDGRVVPYNLVTDFAYKTTALPQS
jgi:hypothetical protein